MPDETTSATDDAQVKPPPLGRGVVVAKDTRQMVTTILDSMAAIVRGDPNVVGGRDIVLEDALIDQAKTDAAVEVTPGDASTVKAKAGQVAASGNIDAAVQAAYQAGFRGDALVTAVAIAAGESGYNAQAHNPNASTGDNSYGLWQINMLGNMGPQRRAQFGIESNEALFDPVTNAKAAFAVSGGGQNFSPWTVYKKGTYKGHLDTARAAVNRFLTEQAKPAPQGGEVL